jgi:hypothetical protein
MDRYVLANGVYISVVGFWVVILHLPTHKYLAINCEHLSELLDVLALSAQHPRRLVQFCPESALRYASEIRKLLSAKIIAIESSTVTTRPIRELPLPLKSNISVPQGIRTNLSIIATVRFVASYIRVRFCLKFLGLQWLVERLQARGVGTAKTSVDASALATMRRVVRTFRRLRIWAYTAHEHCLFDSLVLTDFLRRYRLPANFVIGTHPMPFSAHAWVQMAEWAIDDTAEDLRIYSRILVA